MASLVKFCRISESLSPIELVTKELPLSVMSCAVNVVPPKSASLELFCSVTCCSEADAGNDAVAELVSASVLAVIAAPASTTVEPPLIVRVLKVNGLDAA